VKFSVSDPKARIFANVPEKTVLRTFRGRRQNVTRGGGRGRRRRRRRRRKGSKLTDKELNYF
jgi:hypothetical protein